MSKRQLSALLGFWVIIFLFLGFPFNWDRWIAVITGILIIFVAYKKVSRQKSPSNNAYVQNNAVQETPAARTPVAPSAPAEDEPTTAQ